MFLGAKTTVRNQSRARRNPVVWIFPKGRIEISPVCTKGRSWSRLIEEAAIYPSRLLRRFERCRRLIEGLVFGVVVDISARESVEDKVTCSGRVNNENEKITQK